MLQVLWERGWIDVSKLAKYQKEVVDDNDKVVHEFSLVAMMDSAPDFIAEMSQLEYVCKELGNRAGIKVEAVMTTKYHAEYAGEGIEYSWGYSKALYRRQPLEKKKKTKDKFYELVDYCTSRSVLTTDLVRKFSKRARSYMVTYKSIEMHDDAEASPETPISHHKIEAMLKVVKSHRAALDFDSHFVFKTACVDGFSFKKEVEEKAQGKVAGIKRKLNKNN